MTYRRLALLAVVLAIAGCQATPGAPTQATASPSPSGEPSREPSPSATVALPGTIAFARVDAEGVEHYATIAPDGSMEEDLFTIEGCSCIQLSPDGQKIWTLSETDHGTVAFTTMRPDGSDRIAHIPPTRTLSLAPGPGASTPDGELIAFFGWDDTRTDATGLYLAGPDLADLRLVMPLPDGVNGVEPYGITPDGSRVLFFAERGTIGPVTHAGDLFVVDADGGNLRRLNPEGVSIGTVRGLPASLSPDGTRVAFAGFEGDAEQSAVYVGSLDGGEAEPITKPESGIWSASWAPVGERIAFARWSGDIAALSIVNADGSDVLQLSGAADAVGSGAWSPTGEHLLVSRGPEGQRDLWILDLEGTFITQVTHQPAELGVYTWG